MLLYFAVDEDDTCFHSSKIFNNLEDLYKELMDYRKNVHFVYSVSLFLVLYTFLCCIWVFFSHRVYFCGTFSCR